MIVENKKFYHIHKISTKNEFWYPGAIIDNSSPDFINAFYEMVEIFSYSVPFNTQPTNLEQVLEFYLSQPGLLDPKTILQLLTDSAMFIREYNILKREAVLESVRKEFYPNLPSRKKVIWLCEERQLEYWKLALREAYVLYEVEVTGEVFVSSDLILPLSSDSYRTTIAKAHNYWNYDQANVDDLKVEYLFVGQLTVTREIH
jgi:hypothetical protein